MNVAPFDLPALREWTAKLAAKGIFIGTSSWKYAGWAGQIYEPSRYEFRGRFAQSRFERDCLGEYGETFKTVCVDAAYYTFPKVESLQQLQAQVPSDFRFGFKVTDEITVKRYPNLPRFGIRAGGVNENFLNAALFTERFLGPMQAIRQNVGPIIFEFSKFYPADYAHGRDFVADLDRFFSELPTGWPYAIELRNRLWLADDYLACLARRGVAHVFNNWTAMPPVGEQMTVAQGKSSPNLAVARFLLRPGRSYEAAVKQFEPYAETKEIDADARAAGARLVRTSLTCKPSGGCFLFVNNRLEGNAPNTIVAMLDLAATSDHPQSPTP